MATVLNQFETEQDQQNNENPGQGLNPTFQAPTIGGPQGGGVATPGTSSSPTSSGRFNNLQKYLNANKDFKADQGGLAGNIVGNINQQAQNVQQNVQGATNAFNQQSQQAVNAFTNPNLVNRAFQDPTAFLYGSSINQNSNAPKTPMGQTSENTADMGMREGSGQAPSPELTSVSPPVVNQANLDAFAQMRDAQYTGPKSFQDLSGDQNLAKLQTQSANVNDLVNQGQTESGRFNLLKTMYGKPSYTAGQQNLDNLLLQANKGQLNQIQGARQIATNTNRALNQGQEAAAQQAQQAQQQAQATQADVRGRLNEAVMGEQSDINARLPEAQAGQQAATSAAAQALQSGLIKPEDLQRLMAQSPEFKEGMNLYNVDATPYISAQGTPTAQNIATKADYDKFNALRTLIGNTANEQASSTLASFNNPELAGSFAAGPQYGLDVNRFLGAVNAAGGEYNTQATTDQDAINQAVAALHGGGPGLPEGGFMGQAARDAEQLRTELGAKQGYSPELASQMGLPYTDYKTISDLDMLKNYGNKDLIGGDTMNVIGHYNPYESTISGINSNNQKQADYTNKLKQLQEMYKYGRVLTTDPNKAYVAPASGPNRAR